MSTECYAVKGKHKQTSLLVRKNHSFCEKIISNPGKILFLGAVGFASLVWYFGPDLLSIELPRKNDNGLDEYPSGLEYNSQKKDQIIPGHHTQKKTNSFEIFTLYDLLSARQRLQQRGISLVSDKDILKIKSLGNLASKPTVLEGCVGFSDTPSRDLITGGISNCIVVAAADLKETMLAHIYLAPSTVNAIKNNETLWAPIVSYCARHQNTEISVVGSNAISLDMVTQHLDFLRVKYKIFSRDGWTREPGAPGGAMRGIVTISGDKGMRISEYNEKHNLEVAKRFPSTSFHEQDLIEIKTRA